MLAHPPESEGGFVGGLGSGCISWLVDLGCSRWLVFALSLPILHLAFNTAGILDANLEPARNAFTLLGCREHGMLSPYSMNNFWVASSHICARERAEVNEQLQFARGVPRHRTARRCIAHDFNNKVTVRQASSELLDEQPVVYDPRMRFTARILKTTEQAAAVVSQLLGFSRNR